MIPSMTWICGNLAMKRANKRTWPTLGRLLFIRLPRLVILINLFEFGIIQVPDDRVLNDTKFVMVYREMAMKRKDKQKLNKKFDQIHLFVRLKVNSQ